jgi:hypothetical protein
VTHTARGSNIDVRNSLETRSGKNWIHCGLLRGAIRRLFIRHGNPDSNHVPLTVQARELAEAALKEVDPVVLLKKRDTFEQQVRNIT